MSLIVFFVVAVSVCLLLAILLEGPDRNRNRHPLDDQRLRKRPSLLDKLRKNNHFM